MHYAHGYGEFGNYLTLDTLPYTIIRQGGINFEFVNSN
jgi:hypothetical protein